MLQFFFRQREEGVIIMVVWSLQEILAIFILPQSLHQQSMSLKLYGVCS